MSADNELTRKYLENLQFDYICFKQDVYGFPIQTYDISLQRDIIVDTLQKAMYKQKRSPNDLLAAVSEIEKTVLYTKYQDPTTYGILANIVDDIYDILPNLLPLLYKQGIVKISEVDYKNRPLIGTIDSYFFTAEVDCPHDVLIVISEGVFMCANLISKIIAQAFPSSGDDKQTFSWDISLILQKIGNNHEISYYFHDLMIACLLTNSPTLARQYYPDESYLVMSWIIRHSFECFVVAHEYAHFILGHLDKNLKHKLVSIENHSDPQFIHNWNEEFEADRLATIITQNIMQKKGFDEHLSMLGIVAATQTFLLFEKIEAMRSEGGRWMSILSHSHPFASTRNDVLINIFFNPETKKNWLQRIFPEGKKKSWHEKEECSLFFSITFLLDFLWKEFEISIKYLTNYLAMQDESLYNVPYYEVMERITNMISNKKSVKKQPDNLDDSKDANTDDSVALLYSNMANDFLSERDYANASEYYKKAIKVYETLYGEGNISSATIYNNLAVIYQEQEDYENALEFYHKTLTIRQSILGMNHPDTARTLSKIAIIYELQENKINSRLFYLLAYRAFWFNERESHLMKFLEQKLEPFHKEENPQIEFRSWFSDEMEKL